MAKRKKGKKGKKKESRSLADILSSDAVRVISSHVNAAIPARIGVTGAVTVTLVDAVTGQVIKTVSSLAEEVLSDPALPKKDRRLLKTPEGLGDLLTLVSLFLAVAIATDQKLDHRQTDQILKRIAQGVAQITESVEQIVPSHSEPAPPTPKKPSRSTSKPKTPVSRKNQKTRPNQRARKKKE